MSFLKSFWNGSSSGKKSGKKEKENSEPRLGSSSASKDDCVFDDATAAETDTNAPFKGGRREGRNLSISRSGRHKLRGKQRSSVISGELYDDSQEKPSQRASTSSTSATVAAPATASAPSGNSSGSRKSNCREMEAKNSRLSSGMSGQATAV